MYHEVSEEKRQAKRKKRILALVFVVALGVAAFFGYREVRTAMNEQAAVSLRQSIMDAAKQCCAIEGAYPLSLEYLEQNYGLTINHEDFVITYQAYANNIAPNVVVIPR